MFFAGVNVSRLRSDGCNDAGVPAVNSDINSDSDPDNEDDDEDVIVVVVVVVVVV